MSNKLPFMPLYVSDYIADTTHLSTEEHGAYILLLMVMWKGEGTLRNDDKLLAKIVRLSPTKWAKIKTTILAFFEVEESRIFHKRISGLIEKSKNLGEKRSEIGRKGGEAKSLKSKEPRLAIGTYLPEQTPSKNLPSYILDLRVQKDNSHSQPSSTSEGAGLGLVERLVEIAGDAFRHDAPHRRDIAPILAVMAKGADLEKDVVPVVAEFAGRPGADLGSWKPIAMEIEARLARHGTRKPFTTAEMTTADWDRYLAKFQNFIEVATKRGLSTSQEWAWSRLLGPRPDEKGCLAPAEVLAKYGYGKQQEAIAK
jgi:uncharacterized protein YdaU (DUF1376 family)